MKRLTTYWLLKYDSSVTTKNPPAVQELKDVGEILLDVYLNDTVAGTGTGNLVFDQTIPEGCTTHGKASFNFSVLGSYDFPGSGNVSFASTAPGSGLPLFVNMSVTSTGPPDCSGNGYLNLPVPLVHYYNFFLVNLGDYHSQTTTQLPGGASVTETWRLLVSSRLGSIL
jgi:hypothetical protein